VLALGGKRENKKKKKNAGGVLARFVLHEHKSMNPDGCDVNKYT